MKYRVGCLFLALLSAACAAERPSPKPGQRRSVVVYCTEPTTWQVAFDRPTDPKGVSGILNDDGVAAAASRAYQTRGVKAVVLLDATRPRGSLEHAQWYSESESGPQLSDQGFSEGLAEFLIQRGLYQKRPGIEPPSPPK